MHVFIGTFMVHTTGTIFLYNMGVLSNKKSDMDICDLNTALCNMRTILYSVGVCYIIWVQYDNIPM